MPPTITIDGARYTADQLRAITASAAATLKALAADGALEQLLRRDQQRNTIDGWPAGGTSSRRSSDINRPTETMALRLADNDHHQDDPVHHLIHDLISATLSAARHAAAAKARHQALTTTHGNLGRVDTTDSCQACERTVAGTAIDRIRSGYCHACFMAWTRAARPDRSVFERARENVSSRDTSRPSAT